VQGTAISFWDVVRTLSRPLISGLVALVLPLAFELSVGQNWLPLPRLTVEVAMFIGIYALMLLYVMGEKSFYLSLIRGLRAPAVAGEKAAAIA
jgi:hypothetical protein